jgi:hypothetical protein
MIQKMNDLLILIHFIFENITTKSVLDQFALN